MTNSIGDKGRIKNPTLSKNNQISERDLLAVYKASKCMSLSLIFEISNQSIISKTHAIIKCSDNALIMFVCVCYAYMQSKHSYPVQASAIQPIFNKQWLKKGP